MFYSLSTLRLSSQKTDYGMGNRYKYYIVEYFIFTYICQLNVVGADNNRLKVLCM
jgi:hypothetical protein